MAADAGTHEHVRDQLGLAAASPGERARLLQALADVHPEVVRDWVEAHPQNLMAYMGWSVEPFHAAGLDDALRYRETLWLAPRGSGKSTADGVMLPAWLALARPEKMDPSLGYLFEGSPRRIGPGNIRIALTSNSADNAASLLWQVKSVLTSERIQRLFGPMEGKRWKDVRADTALRTVSLREPTFTALGLGSKVTGGHYDVVVADDWVTEDNARTELQRRRLSDFWKFTVAPTREPWARTAVNGTRYHPADWYGDVRDLHKRGLWGHVRRTRALEGDPPRSYWPSVYPVEKLLHIREQIGAIAFETQYQNEIDLLLGEFFERQWLEQFKKWSELPEVDRRKARTVIALDPAIKGGTRNDYSVFTVLSYVAPYFYVRRVVRGQWTQHELVNWSRTLFHQYNAAALGVEVVAGMEWLVQELLRTAGIQARPLRPTSFKGKDKQGRASHVRKHFELGRVFLEEPTTDNGVGRLVEEMMAFPNSSQTPGMDDCVDSLVWAMIMMSQPRARLVRLRSRNSRR